MTKSVPAPPPRTSRRVTHTLSYGPILRISDRLAGKRDRPHTGTGHGPDGVVRTTYAARLQATFDENDRSAFARTQDACRQPATQLRELSADLTRLEQLTTAAEGTLAKIPSVPSAAELAVRNGGELHLDDAAVAVRRGREHDARIARAQSTLATLRDERNRHLMLCARHSARLLEEFELGRSVSERLRHYYNRRLANYARQARIPGAAVPVIAVPDWTTRPCPWLPAGLHECSGLAAQQVVPR